MTNKLTKQQEFDKITGKFFDDLGSLFSNDLGGFFGNSITAEIDEKNKEFLTFEEARDQAENYYEFEKGVYMYEIEGKGSKLVEDGEVLIEGVDYVHWFYKGVYEYRIRGGELVKINNNK